MVNLIKARRAEGYFASTDLERKVQVYDEAVPGHARAVQHLGISSPEIPCVCLVQLDSAGIPGRVLWKRHYQEPVVAVEALGQELGLNVATPSLDQAHLVIVGESPETEAKLQSLLAEDWKGKWNSPPERRATLASLQSPSLALLDGTDKVLWSKDLSQVDPALTALAQKLGLTYAVPNRLTWGKDGTILLRVSGGKFSVGSDLKDDCKPLHSVDLGYPYYYLGRTEVTVGQFRRFVEQTGYQTDAERTGRSYVFRAGKFLPQEAACWRTPRGDGHVPADNYPVTQITQNDANAYARWAGLRLPLEEEWEHAAGSQKFPWGDIWDGSFCRNSVQHLEVQTAGPAEVGSYPKDLSPWGCLDMAGNVYEWTSSVYARYTSQSPENPKMNGFRCVMRGGCFGNEDIGDFYTYVRTAVGPQDATEAQGFRLCLSGSRQP